MERNIVKPSQYDFMEYLSYARIRRVVVELQLKDQAELWTKAFIEKIIYQDEQILIRLSSGEIIDKAQILAISTPFETYDLEAIGCMCD